MNEFREAFSLWLWCAAPYGLLTLFDMTLGYQVTPRVNATLDALATLQTPLPEDMPAGPDEAPYWLSLLGLQLVALATAIIAILQFIAEVPNAIR